MAKVLLVDPTGWKGPEGEHRPFINVGIAYLVPMLQRFGHEVIVIDSTNEKQSEEEILSAVNIIHPNVIGISVKTATMRGVRSLSQMIKKIMPNIPIILGGPHTTIAWQELVREPWFDVIFVGEGELILPVICHRLVNNESIDDLPGVVTKTNYHNEFQVIHSLLSPAELDNLPFPEYDLFPQKTQAMLRNISYPLLTSRGCVYNCTYCSVPVISGKGFRKRSPNSIILELKWAQKKYGISKFEIIDDAFNLDMKRSKEICRSLIKEDIGLTWSCPNGLRADCVDEALAELMFRSGCHTVCVGVESAEPSVFASVKKGESIEDIERGIQLFKAAGMKVIGFFIIGLPGDSMKAQERSVAFTRRTGIAGHFCMLIPYPGTELWEWASTNARFIHTIEDSIHFADNLDDIKIIIETDDFSSSERRRAYEMVHTRLGRFDMIIDLNAVRLVRLLRKITFLWQYDRSALWHVIKESVVENIRKIKSVLC